MTSTQTAPSRTGVSTWLGAGALMGFIAGIIFAMFEMVMAAIMGDGFFMPLRMIGAIALGEQGLESTYSLVTAGMVGLIVHMVLAVMFGAVFGGIVGAVPALRASAVVLAVAATIYGLLLWLVNFYLIAPVAFPWFQNADPVVQFVAHTFFFGTVLGVLLAVKPGVDRSR